MLAAFVVTLSAARAEPVELGCVELSTSGGPQLDVATVRSLLHGARPCGERRVRPWVPFDVDPPNFDLRQPELRFILVAAPSEAEPPPE